MLTAKRLSVRVKNIPFVIAIISYLNKFRPIFVLKLDAKPHFYLRTRLFFLKQKFVFCSNDFGI